jgi:hypothetical protein
MHKVINCPIVAARPVVWIAATRPAVGSLCYRAFGECTVVADTTPDATQGEKLRRPQKIKDFKKTRSDCERLAPATRF